MLKHNCPFECCAFDLYSAFAPFHWPKRGHLPQSNYIQTDGHELWPLSCLPQHCLFHRILLDRLSPSLISWVLEGGPNGNGWKTLSSIHYKNVPSDVGRMIATQKKYQRRQVWMYDTPSTNWDQLLSYYFNPISGKEILCDLCIEHSWSYCVHSDIVLSELQRQHLNKKR